MLAIEKSPKKLVLVSILFKYITSNSKEDITLNYILYIYYLVSFKKNNNKFEVW